MEIFFLPLDLISVLVVFLGGGNFLPIFRFIFYKINKEKKREQTIQVHKTWNLEKGGKRKKLLLLTLKSIPRFCCFLEEPLVFAIFTANYRERRVYASKLHFS